MRKPMVFASAFMLVAAFVLMIGVTNALAYTYPGSPDTYSMAPWSSLDGTWDHDNGSDQWDGSAPGELAPPPNGDSPGGVKSYTVDDDTFLRIQDAGRPNKYDVNMGGDPPTYDRWDDPSNRKVYLAHQTDLGLDGAHLEFRIRIATRDQGAPLDDAYPSGGADAPLGTGPIPWPAGGVGSVIQSNGKGMITIASNTLVDPGNLDGENLEGLLGFALAHQEEVVDIPGATDTFPYANVQSDVLLLNEYNPLDQDGTDTGATDSASYVEVGDATQWHTFGVDIAKIGGTLHEYQLSISVDGAPAVTRDVTAGWSPGDLSQYEYFGVTDHYVAMGAPSSGGSTGFDVDYLTVVPEPAAMSLLLLGIAGLGLIRRRR